MPRASKTLYIAAPLALACQITVDPMETATGATDTSDGGGTLVTESATQGTTVEPTGSTSPSTTNPMTSEGTTGNDTSTTTMTGGTTTEGTTTNGPTTDSSTTDNTTNGSTTDSSTTDNTTTVGTTDATTDATTGSSTSGDTTTGGDVGGCPIGWTRARTVTIVNEPEKPLSNFQVFVKIDWDDDMNVDFSDIRFVDAMGQELPYWIEDYTLPIDATVWVKVPIIIAAGETEITMCYGNPDATSASDGEATFVFFDGFDGNTLDASKWETTYPVTTQLGAARITNGAIYTKSSPGKTKNLLTEVKGKLLGNTGNVTPRLAISSAQVPLNPKVMMTQSGAYDSYTPDPKVTLIGQLNGCCDSINYSIIGVGHDEGNVYVFGKRTYSASAKVQWDLPYFIGLGDWYMKNAGEVDILDYVVDWILVRKFTAIEPTTMIGPEMVL